MDPLALLTDLHRANPRQGPGDDGLTAQALRLTGLDASAPLTVADIGCGTGAASLALARLLPQARIVAVDVLPPFLDELARRAAAAGLAGRVTPLLASMEALPFDEGAFDLLWSEGAIYQMGFERGVGAWRRFLKPAGLLVASELTWTTLARPPEIERYWKAEYPEVDLASAKMGVLERQGYAPLGYFMLPESCWRDAYHTPLQARFGEFLQRHDHGAAARAIVEEHRHEIALYAAYSPYFSYGMYIARRLP